MSQFSTQQASNALELLADAASRRQEEFKIYDPVPSKPDSDEECDSESPMYDSFYHSGGATAIHEMTNFNSMEFHKLWNRISSEVLTHFNVGRGRKSMFSPKDVLFMALTTVKHAGNWDFLGRMFGIKGPTFERSITNFIKTFSETVYGTFVVDVEGHFAMKRLLDESKSFTNYPFARYATDVTFQQTNRPMGNHQEVKKYFSGKHKLYGYKVEVSILPTGLAIGATMHYPGSHSDIDIFYGNMFFHKRCLLKKEDEQEIIDTASLVDKYPDKWAVLVDKGYQGASEVARAIHPKKKPRNGFLSAEEEAENKKKSSDRVIAESYFGRMCNLWGVLSQKYRWAEEFYDPLFNFCIGLTNIHITIHPLRDDDRRFYHRYKNRLYSIGEEIVRKRKRKQEKYRARRKRRLEMQFRDWHDSDGDTVSPS